MTATRLPARSTSWSQRAEWNAGPSKLPTPGMSGYFGRLSWPVADTTASNRSVVSVPSGPRVVTAHCWSRSEEHTSELQSLMRISYAVFCLKKQNRHKQNQHAYATSLNKKTQNYKHIHKQSDSK